MAEKTVRHALTVVSSGSASGEASAWARALAERAGWSEERVYALDLCVVEMVSNVVNHGYSEERGRIWLELHVGDDAGMLTITDEAPPFDPLSAPSPAIPASLDDASATGGYGIHMVRATASECRYERRDGRNIFTAQFG
jgi:anti-sigma regulatory factor (Ser/Thr protein kinase)